MKARLDELVACMNAGQRAAFDNAVRSFESFEEHLDGSSTGEPLFMFLSGEGGTGKSLVIKALTLDGRLRWGRTEGLFGPVAVAGPTGVSAHTVDGSTWHSLLGKTGSRLFGPGEVPGPNLVKDLSVNLNGWRHII